MYFSFFFFFFFPLSFLLLFLLLRERERERERDLREASGSMQGLTHQLVKAETCNETETYTTDNHTSTSPRLASPRLHNNLMPSLFPLPPPNISFFSSSPAFSLSPLYLHTILNTLIFLLSFLPNPSRTFTIYYISSYLTLPSSCSSLPSSPTSSPLLLTLWSPL